MTGTTTVSGVDAFPNELLDKIFGYVNDKDEIRRVCKSWYNAAGDVTRYVIRGLYYGLWQGP